MHESDLALVLGWRNHPNVRRNMYSQHEISPQEHQRWFWQNTHNPTKSLLIFETDGVPQGFVQFTRHAADHSIADWGFYIDPKAPKGTGRRMGSAALSFAFNQLNLHKVCGEALGYNAASIGTHQALGFVQEGERLEQHFDGAAFHSVVLFGLLRSEWQKQGEQSHE
jgi:UDP-4-amino-4,6-dideoxy-N-acetyl-beta-L-altrosamine N-acetyltransferase